MTTATTSNGLHNFEKQYTEISAREADVRQIATYNFSSLAVDAQAAEERLARMVGHRELKKWLHELSITIPYDQARKNLFGVEPEMEFNNVILSGPPGVGKTTGGVMIGAYLAAHGLLQQPAVYMATVANLKGENIGESEKLTNQMIKVARGGVLVIDEADSLNVSDIFNVAIVNALNAAIDKERDAGTFFILTGYPDGIQRLMRSNPGLSRRFPYNFTFDHFNNDELCAVLDGVLARRLYVLEPEAHEKALKQLLKAKDMTGDNFGNAGTVEAFVGLMAKNHTRRFYPSDLQQVSQMQEVPNGIVATLYTLDIHDVPQYDPRSRRFISPEWSPIYDLGLSEARPAPPRPRPGGRNLTIVRDPA